ncbi:MAG: PRC-barrel domain-containing protein [Tatlockia sp.]|nr:PRC-barrel domain-containing protein [Tatlockia sp.]
MLKKIVNSDNIIGVNVKNKQGEKLGKIEAVMFDKLHGRIAFVVLSFGGYLTVCDKLFALPWSMFSYDNSKDCFVVHLTKERLKNSPWFDKDHWPNMSDLAWSNSIYNYYGINTRYPDQH